MDLELMRHRGPDARGSWQSRDGVCWLGHTRLSIVDLSEAGAQPMSSATGQRHIVFNGEIYNHLELRSRLEGYPWRGASDTETILAAYDRWGLGMLSRLKGMFAFAIYDCETQSLVAARDRFGMKPLYFCRQGGELLIASEVRLLRSACPGPIDKEGVADYLRHGAAREERLLWSNLRCVPPGQWLRVERNGEQSQGTYWPSIPPRRLPAGDPAACVRQLLEYSVEDHLQADVRVASFLSGGVDSSIITALAARKMGGPLRTFSVAFRQGGLDESDIAAEVARRYRTEHTRLELEEADVLGLVELAVSQLDLPSVDALNTFIIAHSVASNGIKVALSGLGSDELFGGYSIFRETRALRQISRIPERLRSVLSWLGSKGRRLADLPPNASAAAIARWRRRFVTDAELKGLGLPCAPSSPNAPMPLPGEDSFADTSASELTGYMRDMLLRDSDQMSMAVSLELRLPFLDHELVEFVLGLPAREKERRGRIKPLLIDACKDLIPRGVYERPKMGFGLPMREWMMGPLVGLVNQGLNASSELGLLPAAGRAEMTRAFRCGRLHWTRVWSWVVLGLYFVRQGGAQSASAVEREAELLRQVS
ncbi:MAG: asparagine synthase (glutamine-hydrolyzing) [Verrucomicrobia bacterium]|nr:asparagine synthase (glutamine-hydrolyzing) [Verrucomicrobiota bacterium]